LSYYLCFFLKEERKKWNAAWLDFFILPCSLFYIHESNFFVISNTWWSSILFSLGKWFLGSVGTGFTPHVILISPGEVSLDDWYLFWKCCCTLYMLFGSIIVCLVLPDTTNYLPMFSALSSVHIQSISCCSKVNLIGEGI
jgi:hypothetical protein